MIRTLEKQTFQNDDRTFVAFDSDVFLSLESREFEISAKFMSIDLDCQDEHLDSSQVSLLESQI